MPTYNVFSLNQEDGSWSQFAILQEKNARAAVRIGGGRIKAIESVTGIKITLDNVDEEE